MIVVFAPRAQIIVDMPKVSVLNNGPWLECIMGAIEDVVSSGDERLRV